MSKKKDRTPEGPGQVPGVDDEDISQVEAFLRRIRQVEAPPSESVYRNIHIIINPAAGADEPILNTLNDVFKESEADWQVHITKGNDDAKAFVPQALEAGADVIAAYGGDGTVMAVAGALADAKTQIPLAILPGGTGNAIAMELGVPRKLVQAAALINGAPSFQRNVDLGKTGDGYFMLRLGVGVLADIDLGADRETKDAIGILAYPLSIFQHFTNLEPARYELELDGEKVETEGVLCSVLNAATLGISGLSLSKNVDINDGLLEVVVLSQANLSALASFASSSISGEIQGDEFQHWSVREVRINSIPSQKVTTDGELLGETPITARAVKDAIKVIVPHEAIRPMLDYSTESSTK